MNPSYVGVIVILVLIYLVLALWHPRKAEDEKRPEPDTYPLSRAQAAYAQALRNFDRADPEYIDIAITDLGITENRVNNELLKLRMEWHREPMTLQTTDP